MQAQITELQEQLQKFLPGDELGGGFSHEGYQNPYKELANPIKVHSSDDWRTPHDLVVKLDNEFHFVYDLAADDKNHLFDKYYTLENNGLEHDWDQTSFANIPYSAPKVWYAKARQDSLEFGSTIVLMVKVATSENYWVENIKDAHVRFLHGRVKFWDEDNKPHYGATFGSAFIIFSPDTHSNPKTEYWNYREETPRKLF